MPNQRVHVIGAGLAGSEAAFQLAERGHQVVLHEMRPSMMTPAHKTGLAAELVCSNSFKSNSPTSAPGILKAEMRHAGSLILRAAAQASVPGGEALAVDRDLFSQTVNQVLESHPRISKENDEVRRPIDGEITLLATGPLTSESLCSWLTAATGEDDLYFYDAIAPIIDASTIDMNHAFLANRYDKGDDVAYLNCPLNESEYREFVSALMSAEKVPPKNFEKEKFFAGCQPIEAIAQSGADTLRFGPMKPVGLTDPLTGKRPYAVLQLRPENRSLTAYNMVGFQTKLKYGEQKRIFSLIPALKNAEFFRLGSIHRNTYVCGPKVLRPDLSLKKFPTVYLAGQITGVEGYLESAACGLLASFFIHQRLSKKPHLAPPVTTGMGALLNHIVASDPKNYQPANMQFGLFDPGLFENLNGLKKDGVRSGITEQALENFKKYYVLFK